MPNKMHTVDETLIFDQKMFAKVSNIKGVSDIKVDGTIMLSEADDVIVNLNLTGTMYLPCVNTGEIGDYDFSIEISDVLDEEYDGVADFEHDCIDLLELVWQKLIVEAPTRFVKNKSKIKSGKSWQLFSEEEYEEFNNEHIDPRFEKLKDLFKEDD
ncbi:MAG: hypothetical protein RR601_02060 [Erysipelotrichales bacterium]